MSPLGTPLFLTSHKFHEARLVLKRTSQAVPDALFRQQFSKCAADPEQFHALMSRVYGPGYDRAAAESEDRLAAIHADNDHGTIIVDGKHVEVEFWSLRKPLKKADRAARKLTRGAHDTINDSIKASVDFSIHGLNGMARSSEALLRGDPEAAAKEGWRTLRDGNKQLVNQLIADNVRVLVDSVDFVDTLSGDLKERRLTDKEIAHLRRVYGDNLDYDAIRIHSRPNPDMRGKERFRATLRTDPSETQYTFYIEISSPESVTHNSDVVRHDDSRMIGPVTYADVFEVTRIGSGLNPVAPLPEADWVPRVRHQRSQVSDFAGRGDQIATTAVPVALFPWSVS